MSADKLTLFIGEPNNIFLEGLRNNASGSYQNSATVTASIRTSGVSATSGTEIASVTLSYVAASNGNYRGDSASLTTLTQDTDYWIWITASGYTLRRIACRADYRGIR